VSPQEPTSQLRLQGNSTCEFHYEGKRHTSAHTHVGAKLLHSSVTKQKIPTQTQNPKKSQNSIPKTSHENPGKRSQQSLLSGLRTFNVPQLSHHQDT